MRNDKLSAFKQRLRQGANNFEFDALIEGVSTLDKPEVIPEPIAPLAPPPVEPDLLAPTPAQPLESADTGAVTASGRAAEGLAASAAMLEPADASAAAGVSAAVIGPPDVLAPGERAPDAEPPREQRLGERPSELAAASARPDVPAPAVPGGEDRLSLADLAVVREPSGVGVVQQERLQSALHSLSRRLTAEASQMRSALSLGDIEDAGFHLAHVNQVLELLQDLDPTGDLSRQLEIAGAPPAGRAWPDTAWSVTEFAQSPLSGLLPAGADDTLVRALLYAAWGVSIDPLEASANP